MADMKRDLILKIVKALDVVLLAIPFAVCWYGYYASRIVSPFFPEGKLGCDRAVLCDLYFLRKYL